MNPDSPLAALLAGPVHPGVLRWIGLRPARRVPMLVAEAVVLTPEDGLVGDRFAGRPGAPRQVTLLQQEHLAVIAGFLRLEALDPAPLRRNLVVSGLNLAALKGRQFRVGTALLEGTGECRPCSRMEEAFGPGGYNAVRGHGGITARVLQPGSARLGDAVLA